MDCGQDLKDAFGIQVGVENFHEVALPFEIEIGNVRVIGLAKFP